MSKINTVTNNSSTTFVVWYDDGAGWHRENTYANQAQAERECRCLVDDDGYDAAVVETLVEEMVYAYRGEEV